MAAVSGRLIGRLASQAPMRLIDSGSLKTMRLDAGERSVGN
jgi:hypothetical protein